MRVALLTAQRRSLRLQEIPVPEPSSVEILLRVEACAVCRTDIHVADGDLTRPKLPLVLGHEIVGRVERFGDRVRGFSRGDRVGVPWLGATCGACRYCRTQRENLCPEAEFTGYTRDGGFAEYTTADARFCFPVSDTAPATELAPLLCAGLIGYRSLLAAGDAESIGIYGFGSAGRLLAQVALFQGRKVFVLTRPGDVAAQTAARQLGATWAGDSGATLPEPLEAAIIFAPVGALVPEALRAVEPGGTVVCGGIHMTDIPSFPYADLWGERTIRSVANLTRQDGKEFLALAARVPVRTEVEVFSLDQAQAALDRLRSGRLTGTAVLDLARRETSHGG